MGNQCMGCIYYKSLGACGEGTEKLSLIHI